MWKLKRQLFSPWIMTEGATFFFLFGSYWINKADLLWYGATFLNLEAYKREKRRPRHLIQIFLTRCSVKAEHSSKSHLVWQKFPMCHMGMSLVVCMPDVLPYKHHLCCHSWDFSGTKTPCNCLNLRMVMWNLGHNLHNYILTLCAEQDSLGNLFAIPTLSSCIYEVVFTLGSYPSVVYSNLPSHQWRT